MTEQIADIPKWHMKADYVESCNCDFGCPCNLSGFPTYGFCRALVLNHIRDGKFGDTDLAGIDVITAASWPKAIHEGNGTFQIFIAKNTSVAQRQAILAIFSGKAKGEGPFAVFAATFKYVLEPQFVDMKVKIDGKRSSFAIPDILDVGIEGFRNPVTGEDQDTKMSIPQGFIFKEADCAKSTIMKILTPNLNFDDSGKNAFYAVVQYKGP